MLSVSPRRSGRAGFSLAEVLIALSIAALVGVGLTRFVAETRWNAHWIGEALEMTALSETLLARTQFGQSWSASRADGRSGAYGWRMEMRPAGFRASVRMRAQKETQAAVAPAAGTTHGLNLEPDRVAADQKSAPSAASADKLSIYRLTVTVVAPSGRAYATDTIRVGADASDGQ
jgi:prepilin-type N-terminal cleavage/methylation domain-containing protein